MTAAAVDPGRVDGLLETRGAATLQDLQCTEDQALALASERPEIEPVYLVRFRSRQDKVRVQEVRAFAWPSEQIALRHLGYRAEQARMLRLEPRARVPFPARLYATFEKKPKELEELRLAEKAFRKAIAQASSKPGRAEMDLLPLQAAFAKLGNEVALEMWIEAASVFQSLDNPTYASKMLGNLLKLVSKDKKVDASLLVRTVLSAADDGVFNSHLYEFTWDLLRGKLSTAVALGFGLRVFRRLVASGRALPADFTKDLRRAASKDKVAEFEALFDSNLVWAAGQASFWNTAKKSSSWRESATAEHGETELLRARLRELWLSSNELGAAGETWRSGLFERIRTIVPELTSYGRTVLLENLLKAGGNTRPDHERLLEAALAVATRAPLSNDRPRTEVATERALTLLAEQAADTLWERAGALDDALRATTGDLTSFVALYDLLSDVSDAMPPRAPPAGGGPVSLLASLAGVLPAWTGALSAALKPGQNENDDYDDDNSSTAPIGAIAEALSLMTPATAGEALAEIGPALSRALAEALKSGSELPAWGRVLGSLVALGPLGAAVTARATEEFVAAAGSSEQFAHAASVAHHLDTSALRRVAESRSVVDEALELMLGGAAPAPRVVKLLRPEKEVGANPIVIDIFQLPGGVRSVLWGRSAGSSWNPEPQKVVVTTNIAPDGEQTMGLTVDVKGATHVRQWATAAGLRLIFAKDEKATFLDPSSGKVLGRISLANSYRAPQFLCGQDVALINDYEQATLVDPAGKVLSTPESPRGMWQLLEREGGPPAMLRWMHQDLEAIWASPDKPLLALKIPDADDARFKVAWATEDGALHVDFVTKKGVRRRATFNEAQARWLFGDGTRAPEGRVIGFAQLDGSVLDDETRPLWGSMRLVVGRKPGLLAFRDPLGTPLAAVRAWAGETRNAFDATTGTTFLGEEMWIDPSFPVRLKCAAGLRSLITGEPDEPLPKAAYAGEALCAHILNRMALRPGGAQVIEELGEHAAGLVQAAARALGEPLEARAVVLRALDQPPPPARAIPARVPGIRRTSLRRAVRDELGGATHLLWSLQSQDPGPVLDTLFPQDFAVSTDALPTGVQLLALAQDHETEPAIAARALDLADVVSGALVQPDRRFVLEAIAPAGNEDDEWDDAPSYDDRVVARRLSQLGHPLLARPAGAFPKKSPPVPLPDGAEARRATLREWVAGILQPLAPTRLEVLTESGPMGHYRGHVRTHGFDFGVDVLVAVTGEGLFWQLRALSGVAPAAAWGQLFARVGKALGALPCGNDARIWPGAGVVHPEDAAALHEGVAFTRSRLADREALQPLRWTAPPIKGLSADDARYVMLAWLLGGIDAVEFQATRAQCERIAKACPLVEKTWRGLEPKRGSKTGDELQYSDEYTDLVRRHVWWVKGGGRRSDGTKIVVLTDPAVLAQAFAREAGVKPGRGA